MFPTDSPRNMRFSINFFTSIGLGGEGCSSCCLIVSLVVGHRSFSFNRFTSIGLGGKQLRGPEVLGIAHPQFRMLDCIDVCCLGSRAS